MTAILAMASLKGGTGKTTVGLNLAVTAEEAGIPTVIVDVDPQQASAKWGDLRGLTGHRPHHGLAGRLCFDRGDAEVLRAGQAEGAARFHQLPDGRVVGSAEEGHRRAGDAAEEARLRAVANDVES